MYLNKTGLEFFGFQFFKFYDGSHDEFVNNLL